MIGATGNDFTVTQSGFYVDPIRTDTGSSFLYYTINKEIVSNSNFQIGINGSSFSDLRKGTVTFLNVQLNQLQSISQNITYASFSGTPSFISNIDFPFSINFSNSSSTSTTCYITNLGTPQENPVNVNGNWIAYI